METPSTADLKHARSARRWANAFSAPSFLFIIICAAFADPMAFKIGIPAMVVYVIAIAAGILTLTMILGAESSTSSAVYRVLGIVYAVLAVVLCAIFSAYVVADAAGDFTVNEIGSLGIVAGLAVIALAFLAVAVSRRSQIA